MTEIQHKTKRTLYDQEVPNLVELQIRSYEWFLAEGLRELFRSFSPINDYANNFSLELVDYRLDEPKYTEEECRYRDMTTYEAPIKARVNLIKKEDGKILEVIPEEVYLGELPIMTENGTFVINGAERVVVSQLSRSPGAYFEDDIDLSGKLLYTGRIIPTSGAWIEMITDSHNIMNAHLAQSAKFPFTVLLRSLNNLSEACPVDIDSLIDTKISNNIIYPSTGEIIFEAKTLITKEKAEKLKSIFGNYIYNKDLSSKIATTVELLEVFGKKEFTRIERIYHLKTGETVRVPAEDKSSKINKLFRKFAKDVHDINGDVVFSEGSAIDEKAIRWIEENIDKEKEKDKKLYSVERLRPVSDIKDESGNVVCAAAEIIDKDAASILYNQKSVYLEYYEVDPFVDETLKNENPKQDPNTNHKPLEPVVDERTAILALQRFLRPKEPSNEKAALDLVRGYLFDNRRYDIGKVGRYKLNRKLGLDLPEFAVLPEGMTRSITRDDIVKLIKYSICLNSEGKMITEFITERRDAILPKMEEFIKEAEKEASFEEKLPDGKIAKYKKFLATISGAKRGLLLSKSEYEEFFRFMQDVGKATGDEAIKFAVSDSPANLNLDYVVMRFSPCNVDEIDHLENKRVRSVGELLQEQLRNGFLRMEKVARERMIHHDIDKVMPQLLLSVKPISASIRSFFGSSQLSQFMDQTNPLAELTHKRRLSALGPGGLSRQSAKLEVRDVHHSHYGRICPIETPEGPNIGLIGSMAIHARINEYGFLETPYRIVKDGIITTDIKYLSAEEEGHEYIATANTKYNEKTGEIANRSIPVRHDGKYPKVDYKKVTLMEISPNQIMSVAANLIPFIENDDANRALMGSNMQRQAVPLLKPTAPVVRTGIEGRAAHDSGVERLAKRDGKVVWVSCEHIVVLPEKPNFIDEYQVTCLFDKSKKVFNKREPLFRCDLTRYNFDDKDKKYPISVDNLTIDSKIERTGAASPIVIDGDKYVAIDPETEIVVTVEEIEDIEKNDLIYNGKVFALKSKEYFSKDVSLSVVNGIVTGIDKNTNEVKIKEYDIYSITPKIIRNAFPPKHGICRYGMIDVISKSAGVGTGEDNEILLSNDGKTATFDVIVCDNSKLTNMVRSNQGTCINSRAMVNVGQRVRFDELLADGPCTDHGELALGQNVTVAFMPWNGYNYEDAILLNQRLVKDDIFSSVHIEKFEIEARDTKLGPEEITRDIPNVSDDSLKDLDTRGIIKIGASVKAEDILVGKVAPKGQSELTAEERLIIAIFGKKAEDTRDVSLKVPHGETGTVVDVKVFSRHRYRCSNPDCAKTFELCKKLEKKEQKCERCNADLIVCEGDELNAGVNQLVRVYIAQKRKIMQGDKMAGRHGNKGVISNILQEADMPFRPDGSPVDIVLNPLGVPSRMNIGQILETHQGYAGTNLDIKFKNPIFQSSTEKEIISDLELMTTKKLVDTLKKYIDELEINVTISERSIDRALRVAIDGVSELVGETLADVAKPLEELKVKFLASVLEEVKTYDAYDLELLSRQLSGDVVINEDSEEFEEVLSNLEELKHKKYQLQKQEDSSDEDGNVIDSLNEIEEEIKEVKSFGEYEVPSNYNYDKLFERIDTIIIKRVGFHAQLAKTDLYDGRTGLRLSQPVAVGTIYMLKLAHLVEDKIHARATGPYSLVTQQPLGGKAQFGGQRFGEMEVWALEAYGAAYTLQEILTIKSDDVVGRVKTYEAIVKGKTIAEPGIPESFKILVNELQSLCLRVTVEDDEGKAIDIKTYDDFGAKDAYDSPEMAVTRQGGH